MGLAKTEDERRIVIGIKQKRRFKECLNTRCSMPSHLLKKDNGLGSGPRCQDTILGDMNSQTRFEITSIQFIIMSSPKFAETHNVVAFLEKPKESDGFAEIIDFLKASSVSYALTVNPVIYISCIEQFWATAKIIKIDSTQIPIIDQPSTSSNPKKKQPSKKTQRQEAEVWIMQISQENGQNRTNTDTGTDRVYKS
ncbi:hypothetical protein Tco_0138860 [Tanacetum coccineum]